MLQKITVMIYLIFVQYRKHRMQITQERWGYVLTTNSCSLCNEWILCCQTVTVAFVTNTYCSPPTW